MAMDTDRVAGSTSVHPAETADLDAVRETGLPLPTPQRLDRGPRLSPLASIPPARDRTPRATYKPPGAPRQRYRGKTCTRRIGVRARPLRSEEHTSELQSQ